VTAQKLGKASSPLFQLLRDPLLEPKPHVGEGFKVEVEGLRDGIKLITFAITTAYMAIAFTRLVARSCARCPRLGDEGYKEKAS